MLTRSRILPWLPLAGLSVASFLALWLPARIPVVDLPMHARMLALLTDPALAGEAACYAPNPAAPYWLFYGLAAPFTWCMPAYEAAQTAYALLVAAVPLAVGAWLRAARRSPALGLHSGWVLFSAVVGWGFVGVVAGLPLLALVMAAAERVARSRRRGPALLLGALLVAVYYTHISVWACAVALVGWVALTRRVGWRRWIPAASGAAIGGALAGMFSLTLAGTPYLTGTAARYGGMGLHWFPPEGLARFLDMAASYGLTERRLPLVTILASLWAVQVLLGMRAASQRLRAPGRLFRFRYPVAVAGALLALAFCDDVLLVHERLVWVLGALGVMTLRLPARQGALLAARGVLAATLVFGLLASADAYAAALSYSRATACLDTFAGRPGGPGRMLTLQFLPTPRGYALPVDTHLGAYLAARWRGGTMSFEFAHSGVHVLRPRDVRALPRATIMGLHAAPKYYRPGFARDFDTILVSPPFDPGELLGESRPDFEYGVCGPFGLALRTRSNGESAARESPVGESP
ncbi:MAG: hypothetical protein PHU25_03945 [Deltaproteobacteria bacterium]|nr:hypothetical protein [Deltaproteobacteria bacterium]